MATHELVTLPHVIVDGHRVAPDAGEAHCRVRVLVRYSGNDREVTAVAATDLFTGARYDRDELERLASDKGRKHLDDEIDAALEEHEKTDHTHTRWHCLRCAVTALRVAA